jgi:hypothetical protein
MCEKPQVQKADLSYRRARQRYCSVVDFWPTALVVA